MASKRKRNSAASTADPAATLSFTHSAENTPPTTKEPRVSQTSSAVSSQGEHDDEQDKDEEGGDISDSQDIPRRDSSSSDSSASATPMYSYPINPPPVGRPVRIYCDGIYDLFHFGHAKALEQAKKAFPDVYLMVGVCDDIQTHRRKGKTVMTDKERYESLRHCKWVDEVIEAAPWIVDQAFLDEHKIDYVAHDDIPYKSLDSDDVYAFVKKSGHFLPTQRTEGVSTSDLITRIVKDYDQYLRRNLERGVPAKELGIGFFKEQEVKLKKSAQDLRSSIRQNWTGTKDDLKSEIAVLRSDLRQIMNIWEDKSHDFVRDTFGVDSVVNKIFSSRRRRNGASSRLVTDTGGDSPNTDEGLSSRTDSRDVSDSEEGYGRQGSLWKQQNASRSQSEGLDLSEDKSPLPAL
ncbi:hypothetical protein BC939DRAFT_437579 [Gamsiella multidivaricata]|uniref:uncharacterized protein n=1 Tax=Gamsiella multidivaricata TaxID=101098 RepID=UPI00221FD366|nr:uncharacterized protein BC939DRAFT_437579 [Gamsiella multidivaricata]KAG0353816.1 hypothetical protein BGZ54_002031 [Gamsiella multidivaricata]KAI7831094.1 hypothetical protein BC939DRAFT_437579 [Gamsiella multidivaricata]